MACPDWPSPRTCEQPGPGISQDVKRIKSSFESRDAPDTATETRPHFQPRPPFRHVPKQRTLQSDIPGSSPTVVLVLGDALVLCLIWVRNARAYEHRSCFPSSRNRCHPSITLLIPPSRTWLPGFPP